jgi:hypothetical protein
VIEVGSVTESLTEAGIRAEQTGKAFAAFEFGSTEDPRYGVADRREAADLKRASAKLKSHFEIRYIVSVPKLQEPRIGRARPAGVED